MNSRFTSLGIALAATAITAAASPAQSTKHLRMYGLQFDGTSKNVALEIPLPPAANIVLQANGQYQDYLVYDFQVNQSSERYWNHVGGVGHLDLLAGNQRASSYSNYVDQNSVSGHPSTELNNYYSPAWNHWHHRELKVPGQLDQLPLNKLLATAAPKNLNLAFHAMYRDISIIRVQLNSSLPPVRTEIHSDGTATDLSQLNSIDTATGVRSVTLVESRVQSAYSGKTRYFGNATEDLIFANYDVTDPEFGAVSNDTKDDTSAIQSALLAAFESGGGVVFIPAGTYQIQHRLIVPPAVVLRGRWTKPTVVDYPVGPNAATVLEVTEGAGAGSDHLPAILLCTSSGIRDMVIHHPNQSVTNVQPYPWTIRNMDRKHSTLRNVVLVNPYRGMEMGPESNSSSYLKSVYASPLNIGVELELVPDVPRFEGIHFDPTVWANFSSSDNVTPTNVRDAMHGSAVGIRSHRVDWFWMHDVHLEGFKIGLELLKAATSNHAANGQIMESSFKDCGTCIDAVYLNEEGLMITKSIIEPSIDDGSIGIWHRHPSLTNAKGPIIQCNNVTFRSRDDARAILLGSLNTQADNYLSASHCEFDHISGAQSPAVEAHRGSLTLQSCSFPSHVTGDNSVELHSVASAIVRGCSIQGGSPMNISEITIVTAGGPVVVSADTTPNLGIAMCHTPKGTLPNPVAGTWLDAETGDLTWNNNVFTNFTIPPVGDGTTDDGPAIQAMLNVLAALQGGTLVLPPSRVAPIRAYRIESPLSIGAGVELRGSCAVPHDTFYSSTVLFAADTEINHAAPFINLGDNAGIRGLTVYYPGQILASGIVHYPATVRSSASSPYIIDCCIANPYEAVNFVGTTSHYVNGLTGTPLVLGIQASSPNGDGWLQNCHFVWPYLKVVPHDWPRTSLGQAQLRALTPNTLTGFAIGDTQHERLLNNFVLDCRTGIHWLPGAKATSVASGVDAARTCIRVTQWDPNAPIDVDLVNTQIVSLQPDVIPIPTPLANHEWSYIRTTNAPNATLALRMCNTLCWGRPQTGIYLLGGTVTLQQIHLRDQYDHRADSTTTSYGVFAPIGQVDISTSLFGHLNTVSNGGTYLNYWPGSNASSFGNMYVLPDRPALSVDDVQR